MRACTACSAACCDACSASAAPRAAALVLCVVQCMPRIHCVIAAFAPPPSRSVQPCWSCSTACCLAVRCLGCLAVRRRPRTRQHWRQRERGTRPTRCAGVARLLLLLHACMLVPGSALCPTVAALCLTLPTAVCCLCLLLLAPRHAQGPPHPHAYFLACLRRHLHVVLSLDAGAEGFSQRLQQNPALLSCCSMLWWHGWSSSSLAAMATEQLQVCACATTLAAACRHTLPMTHACSRHPAPPCRASCSCWAAPTALSCWRVC